MSRWFRMYDDLVDDPKVQRLAPDLFKLWVNLLCVASKNGGKLPEFEDLVFLLRMGREELVKGLDVLVERGLIDHNEDGVRPHNWDKRQFKSDADPTATERQRKKRERDKSERVTRDKPVMSHPPETEADTETEQREKEPARVKILDDVTATEETHREQARTLLETAALTDWEKQFVGSIKSSRRLSSFQREKFNSIIEAHANAPPAAGSKYSVSDLRKMGLNV